MYSLLWRPSSTSVLAHTYTHTVLLNVANTIQLKLSLLIIPYLIINALVLQREKLIKYFENKGFTLKNKQKKSLGNCFAK